MRILSDPEVGVALIFDSFADLDTHLGNLTAMRNAGRLVYVMCRHEDQGPVLSRDAHGLAERADVCIALSREAVPVTCYLLPGEADGGA